MTNGINEIYCLISDRATNKTTTNLLFEIRKDIVTPGYSILDIPINTANWHNTVPENNDLIYLEFTDFGGSKLNEIYYVVSIDNKLNTHTIDLKVNRDIYRRYWEADWDTLTNGINEIYVFFNDWAGNSLFSDKVFQIKKDIISPSIVNNEDVEQDKYKNWINSTPNINSFNAININFYDEGRSHLKQVFYGVIL